MEFINRIGKDSVPGYLMLNDYEWVDGFLRCREIKREILKFREAKREIKKRNPVKADLLKMVKEQFETYQAERTNFIQQHFKNNFRNKAKGNIFNHLKYHSDSGGWIPYVTLEEIEKAIEGLEEPEGSMKSEEREEELARIEESLAEFRTELSELSPAIYFRIENGKVVDDIREAFYVHWWRIQSKCNAPCGPRGFYLYDSPEIENDAWQKLGLEKAVNRKIRITPNPGS